MDYSFAQACAQFGRNSSEIVVMYDVMCQWYKHLRKRIRESPALREALPNFEQLTLVKAIGLFHVHGHRQECFARFTPDYVEGVGQTEGEIIESLWSILNETSRGCRGMTAAHRQEVMDDHMNHWNWMKLTRMSVYILHSLCY